MKSNILRNATAGLVGLMVLSGCMFNMDAVYITESAVYPAGSITRFFSTSKAIEDEIRVIGREGGDIEVTAVVEAFILRNRKAKIAENLSIGFIENRGALELDLRFDNRSAENFDLETLEIFMPPEVKLELKTDIGNIAVEDMKGDVVAETKIGSIEVVTGGYGILNSNVGKIRATLGEGGNIKSDVGNVSVLITRRDFRGLYVESDVGNVTVVMPYGAGYDLRIKSDTGRVKVNAGEVFFETKSMDDDVYTARINGGGHLVELISDVGNITVMD